MQDPEQKKREDFLERVDIFRQKAFLIISEMVDMENQTEEDTSALVDEVLHSLFFLGAIICPPFSPEMILDDKDICDAFKKDYPGPFQYYSSRLPRRSPLSCVLEMIVHLEQPENEEQIKERLRRLMEDLKKIDSSKILLSFTICVSHSSNSVRYYGVSMSMFGKLSGKIQVAASCFGYWDDYVADAVMTYLPCKKKYYDGTIKLPEDVKCKAFNISEGAEKPPCRSCGDLFGLCTTETKGWPHGNCAEVESLSNLFKNEQKVKIRAKPQSDLWTEDSRKKARGELLRDLKKCWLNDDKFQFKWDGNFYPSESVHRSPSKA